MTPSWWAKTSTNTGRRVSITWRRPSSGAREIATPVTFSILTTIVAFVPLLYMPGTTGKFWWPLPAVVITVLAISLLEALYILPAHLAHSSSRARTRLGHRLHEWQQSFARGFSHFVNTRYRRFLDVCLTHRYITLSVALAVFVVVGGYGLSGHMGMIMMPEVAADEIECGIRLPVGTTPDQAARVAEEVTASTRRMFDEHNLYEVAEGIKTNVRGGSFIDVEIVMRPPDEHDTSAEEIIALWRDEIGDIEGVDQMTFEAERGPGGWQRDISIDLSHSDIERARGGQPGFAGAHRAVRRRGERQRQLRQGQGPVRFHAATGRAEPGPDAAGRRAAGTRRLFRRPGDAADSWHR